MTEENQGELPDSQEAIRGGGAVFIDEKRLKKDIRLVARAIKKRWPIDESKRRPIMARLEQEAIENPDASTAIQAANAVLKADAINQKDEQEPTGNTTINVGTTTVNVREALKERGYLDYLRQLAIDSDTGTLRADDQPGEVAASEAPG